MGRKIDRTLLGLELIGALIFIISIVNYIISELSRRGYIRDITVVYIGTIIFLLILFYGYVFARIKNEDYYLKHKASIKTFIWGILLTIGVMSLSVFFLLFGLGQYGSFLTILSFVLFVIIPIIMFAIELEKIRINKKQFIIINILLIIILSLFFWPKQCGNFTSAMGVAYEKCGCFGIEPSTGMMGGGNTYCLGFCLRNSCEIVQNIGNAKIAKVES